MSSFAVSQILASLALLADLISFQIRGRAGVLACFGVGGLLYSVHFILLDRWSAAAIGFLASIRFLVAMFTSSRTLMWLFVALVGITTYLTYQGPISLLPCLGSICGTIASFQPHDRAVRLMLLPASGAWLLHNVIVGTPGGVAAELLALANNIVGLYRFHWREGRGIEHVPNP